MALKVDYVVKEAAINLRRNVTLSFATVVMATHDRSIVDTMQRRVIELDEGMVVRDQLRGVYQ